MKMRMIVLLRICLLSLLLVIQTMAADQETTTEPLPRVTQACTQYMSNKKKFESSKLPGFGWDNLRNVPLKQVMNLTYSMCTSITNFVVPDQVDVLPILSSEQLPKMQAFVYATHGNVPSQTSQTINLQASLSVPFDTVSGTLSANSREVMKSQYSSAASLLRSYVTLKRYELGLQSSGQLTPSFKEAVLAMANSVQLNFHELARHQAQTLVFNFGTHLTTRTVLGGILLKKDFLLDSYYMVNKWATIMKTSSKNFQRTTGMLNDTNNVSPSFFQTHRERYDAATKISNISFSGGKRPPTGTDNLFNMWVNSIESNMAVIDRAGDPLYHLIRPADFSDVPAHIISHVSHIVRAAIVFYYELNTIPGCIEKTRMGNYSMFANFPDGSCAGSNYDGQRFGGVYQTCRVISGSGGTDMCKEREINNSYTSAMNCPKKYFPRQLFQGTYSRVDEQPCKSSTHESCEPTFNHSEVAYTSYWCQSDQTTGMPNVAPGPKDVGYSFGGFFTTISENRVIQEKACPSKYSPRRILDDLYICVGNIFSPDMGDAFVPIQGFISCQNDSIPTFNLNRGFCEPSFSKILTTSVEGCNIYVCSRIRVDVESAPSFPIGGLTSPSLPVYISSYNGRLIYNTRNQTWVKIDKESFGPQEPKLSYRDAAVLAFLSAFAAIVLCVLVFLLICWCWKRKQPPPLTTTSSQEKEVEKNPSKVTATKPSMLEFDENQI